MKTLLILRHAKSSWSDPSLDDHERPLNGRGRRDAPRVGEVLRDHRLVPDLIISSDAERAEATARAAADKAGYTQEIVLDRRLYHADPEDVIAVLKTVPEANNRTVMIVGHNPGLEDLVAQLTGESQPMPTAALAQVTLPLAAWRDINASTRGTLVDCWLPKELA